VFQKEQKEESRVVKAPPMYDPAVVRDPSRHHFVAQAAVVNLS
jgi:hypothetical protein